MPSCRRKLQVEIFRAIQCKLTILLNLISTHGMSLPDKRTAIYDEYMKVFFSREAVKNEEVRLNRDLLKELHAYVAWHLHMTVERSPSAGNIGQADLVKLLGDYLERDGRQSSASLPNDYFVPRSNVLSHWSQGSKALSKSRFNLFESTSAHAICMIQLPYQQLVGPTGVETRPL